MNKASVIRQFLKLCLVFIILAGLGTQVYAGEKIYSGGPVLSAVLAGSNEIHAGQQEPLSVLIENSGVINMKFVESGYITPDYIPTTARSVKATLSSGSAPLNIKSDPQIIGDLPSGEVLPVSFFVTVPQDAKAGSYNLELIVSYDYMAEAVQIGTDDIEYQFKAEEITIPVPVTLRKDVFLSITDIRTEDLYAGGEGYLSMNIANKGTDAGKDTVLHLSASESNPIVPVDSSIYVGDFRPEDEVNARFKVSVASNADSKQEYPLLVSASYRDYEGLETSTDSVTIGAGFAEKICFDIVSEPSVVHAGATDEIHVIYKNIGENTIDQAEARISVVDPFSSNDDDAYIGTLKPGETGVAVFTLQVDGDATIKEYALDSIVRYTDSENNNYVSDPVKVLIDVKKAENWMLYAGIFVIIIIVAGCGLYFWQKKSA